MFSKNLYILKFVIGKMRHFKTLIVALGSIMIIFLAYPLLGCSGCGGCGGCGEDDVSEDSDADGSYGQERIPNTLGQVQTKQQQNVRTPSICDTQSTNTVQATASKSSTQTGYVYSYSFTMRACASAFGYVVKFEGPVPRVIESGVAQKGRETTSSNSHESTKSYTQLCINTGDSSIGDYCVPFS